jgi:2-oxoisovalerate dehydrogenase E2 component (dihydrolipoyl transacylase)
MRRRWDAAVTGKVVADRAPRPRNQALAASSSSIKASASPPIRKLARELGVDLASLMPTGAHGQVTRDDRRPCGLRQGLPSVETFRDPEHARIHRGATS